MNGTLSLRDRLSEVGGKRINGSHPICAIPVMEAAGIEPAQGFDRAPTRSRFDPQNAAMVSEVERALDPLIEYGSLRFPDRGARPIGSDPGALVLMCY